LERLREIENDRTDGKGVSIILVSEGLVSETQIKEFIIEALSRHKNWF